MSINVYVEFASYNANTIHSINSRLERSGDRYKNVCRKPQVYKNIIKYHFTVAQQGQINGLDQLKNKQK